MYVQRVVLGSMFPKRGLNIRLVQQGAVLTAAAAPHQLAPSLIGVLRGHGLTDALGEQTL